MCKYITQGKADGNSCGAFTLAYYEWEISGHAKAEAADRAYISALYNDIVFGCAMPGFESYSNPMLMMRRLAKQGAKLSIPSRENPLIRQMFGVLSAAAKREVAQMKMLGCSVKPRWTWNSGRIRHPGVSNAGKWRACKQTSLCSDEKSCDREPLILNPWHGEALPSGPTSHPPAHLWN